jgi:exopolyphosphatase / guanosine-5'-triphosphate,3'-diphosphate pyrophosphatase
MGEAPLTRSSMVGIIDLGTNTFNLLIAEVSPVSKTFEVLYATKKAVKLGEGGLTDGRIRPEPMQRAKDTLAEYVAIAQERQCTTMLAFGTSAMRDSANAGELVRWAEEELGLKVTVISGEEEARLITEGVRLAVPMTGSPVLIMDIGGGSTEFIIANGEEVFWQHSYQLGISRIRQLLRPSDPLTADDLGAMDALLSGELREMLAGCERHGVTKLIGSSGSFDSFMDMIRAAKGDSRSVSEMDAEPHAPFGLGELAVLNTLLITKGFDARKAIPGLVEMRVDTIHLASHMVQWVIRSCGIKELELSTYALKEGIISRVMQGRGVEPIGQ